MLWWQPKRVKLVLDASVGCWTWRNVRKEVNSFTRMQENEICNSEVPPKTRRASRLLRCRHDVPRAHMALLKYCPPHMQTRFPVSSSHISIDWRLCKLLGHVTLQHFHKQPSGGLSRGNMWHGVGGSRAQLWVETSSYCVWGCPHVAIK